MRKQIKNHFFWKYGLTHDGIFSDNRLPNLKSLLIIIRLFYGVLFYVMFREAQEIDSLVSKTISEPLWPIIWIDSFEFAHVVYFLVYGTVLCLSLAMIFTENWKVFIIFFQYAAIINSFGKISHIYHHLLIPLFGFIFVPSGDSKNKLRASVFFASTTLFLLFAYTISGWWKLKTGIKQAMIGEDSIFSINSLSNHMARVFIETNESSVIGEWLIYNPIYGSILMLLALYIELCAIFILFRPDLHRFWGLSIAFMHLGIMTTMKINFPHSIIALSVLLIASPFAQDKFSLKNIIFQLPLFGSIISGIAFLNSKKKPSILFYDGDCGVCDGLIQILLKGKISGISFSPLGGKSYSDIYSEQASYIEIDTVLFFSQGRTYMRTQALTRAFLLCNNWYKLIGLVMIIIPSDIMDFGYWLFAPFRKKLIKFNYCSLPSEKQRKMFIA